MNHTRTICALLLAGALPFAYAHDDHQHGHDHQHEHTHQHEAVAHAAQGAAGALSDAKQTGKVFTGKHFIVVKKVMKKGETMPRHNHVGRTVLFTATAGAFDVVLNDSERHTVKQGQTLKFGGEVYISAVAVKPSAVTVVLVDE